LSVDITEEQDMKLVKYHDHGMRNVVFGVMIDDLLELIDRYGAGKVLGLLVERSITLRDMSKLKLGD